jgi:hypothetical protein
LKTEGKAAELSLITLAYRSLGNYFMDRPEEKKPARPGLCCLVPIYLSRPDHTQVFFPRFSSVFFSFLLTLSSRHVRTYICIGHLSPQLFYTTHGKIIVRKITLFCLIAYSLPHLPIQLKKSY